MESNTQRRQTATRTADRRTTSPYRRGTRIPEKKMSFKEKLVMQCIVCSIILGSVLLIKIVNTGFTNRLGDKLETALSNSITVDEVKGTFDNALASLLSMPDSVKTVLGYQSDSQTDTGITTGADGSSFQGEPEIFTETLSENNADLQSGLEEAAKQTQTPSNSEANTKNEQFKDTDFRIDEDILEQINMQEDVYNSQKKPAAPN